jgi:N-acetylmuramoyl-L-alanine amidase
VKKNVLYRDGKPVAQRPSPNHGGIMKRPSILLMHYTATTTASSAINALTDADTDNRVSVHLVLDRDGTVTQLLPFNRVGWHAGKSSWEDESGVNNFSIGIEQVNAGPLLKRADGTLETQLGSHIVPPEDAVWGKHRITGLEAFWQKYPPVQVAAAILIGQAIHKAYPSITEVLGHEDVAPRRKTDPGPAYPLISVASQILGRK